MHTRTLSYRKAGCGLGNYCPAHRDRTNSFNPRTNRRCKRRMAFRVAYSILNASPQHCRHPGLFQTAAGKARPPSRRTPGTATTASDSPTEAA